ncbi:MAG TPA: GspH/FimT family pseudopilin [Pseudoxanthomonas sp.]|nr:GspH/FimT family pseudopilin [Pseudoxanthomonas sp.]
MSKRKSKGFTLIELLVTISVVAIMLALALPSFQSSIRSNRVATTTNELLASLALARSEGIKSTRGGGVCASADGATCGADWNLGWMVWTDPDGDGVFDAGEPVIRFSQGKPQLEVAASAATIAFDGRGRVVGGGKNVGVVPEGTTATPVRCLRIGVTGQTTVEDEACS